MDEELKLHLEGMESRLHEGIERLERLGTTLLELNEKIDRVEASLNEKIELVEARLNEKIERVETSLLTEFHKWASPLEMRQRSHAAAIRAMDSEVEALGDRVSKLERPT